MNTTDSLPLVSILIPAFNEQALLEDHIEQIVNYLRTSIDEYRWELLIINDGSTDKTGQLANMLADRHQEIKALHHPSNFGLGQVFKFGFANSRGEYIITLDVDLSYDVNHIAELLQSISATNAKIVLASPYMSGGSIKNVPWNRRYLSILGNRFLSIFARGKFSTLTSLVRAYDGPFIRSLDLRSRGMDIMPEMLYKANIVHAKIVEIPARLDWGPQKLYSSSRLSSMRVILHISSTVLSGFLFRPFLVFVLPGLVIALFALYVDFWMFRHFFDSLELLRQGNENATYSEAISVAYKNYPHTYIVGLLATTLSIQLIGLGVIALQNTRYFEDLYHLSSSDLRKLKQLIDTENAQK